MNQLNQEIVNKLTANQEVNIILDKMFHKLAAKYYTTIELEIIHSETFISSISHRLIPNQVIRLKQVLNKLMNLKHKELYWFFILPFLTNRNPPKLIKRSYDINGVYLAMNMMSFPQMYNMIFNTANLIEIDLLVSILDNPKLQIRNEILFDKLNEIKNLLSYNYLLMLCSNKILKKAECKHIYQKLHENCMNQNCDLLSIGQFHYFIQKACFSLSLCRRHATCTEIILGNNANGCIRPMGCEF